MIQLQLPSERATADRSRLIQFCLLCGAISGPLAVLVITIDGSCVQATHPSRKWSVISAWVRTPGF